MVHHLRSPIPQNPKSLQPQNHPLGLTLLTPSLVWFYTFNLLYNYLEFLKGLDLTCRDALNPGTGLTLLSISRDSSPLAESLNNRDWNPLPDPHLHQQEHLPGHLDNPLGLVVPNSFSCSSRLVLHVSLEVQNSFKDVSRGDHYDKVTVRPQGFRKYVRWEKWWTDHFSTSLKHS